MRGADAEDPTGRLANVARLTPHAIVLCDVDHGVALAAGLACHLSAELNDLYLKAGLDLATIYGSGGGFLPIPATFVIDRDRMIRYAFVDPDFRYRANPPDVVRFLDAMD